jgi:hypothetical protein
MSQSTRRISCSPGPSPEATRTSPQLQGSWSVGVQPSAQCDDRNRSQADGGGHRETHIRVRVNARGAAYIEGLQPGRTYDAHIKPQWPDTVWPEGTGLPHTCFLVAGMYEIVDEAAAAGSEGDSLSGCH